MMNEVQSCPICGAPVAPVARYPRCVCVTCAAKAVARDGRLLRFFNLSVSGGFGAEYAENHEPYNSHVCYIDGVKCLADEAHMGGIVIQTAR
jgi:recombinational DNA repair protein (RecF pathway)